VTVKSMSSSVEIELDNADISTCHCRASAIGRQQRRANVWPLLPGLVLFVVNRFDQLHRQKVDVSAGFLGEGESGVSSGGCFYLYRQSCGGGGDWTSGRCKQAACFWKEREH
jgi:hypothetical protein